MKDLRIESVDSGSNYQFGDKLEKGNAPKSLFNLSHLVTTTIKNAGLVVPISLIECLPGDHHELDVSSILRVMPQVVPLFSRQRMYVYAFYSRNCDLWNNWETFKKKGYTGNVVKQVPSLSYPFNLYSPTSALPLPIKADSLGDYLGLPQGATVLQLSPYHLSALPLMMYLRIYRDYFMNKNLHLNDRVLLPDDDTRFRLNDYGQLMSAVDAGLGGIVFDISDSDSISLGIFYHQIGQKTNVSYMYDNTYNILHVGLFYHEWPDDYFSSALLSPQRGETPTLNFDARVGVFKSDGTLDRELVYSAYSAGSSVVGLSVESGSSSTVGKFGDTSKTAGFTAGEYLGLSRLGVSLNDIRDLAVKQTIMEKSALTDGSYTQYGLAFFGVSCRNSKDYKPIYIGGISKEIKFTEVLQTSGSSSDTYSGETVNNPLGQIAGHGISFADDGYLGSVDCDDYGYIMILACVMPDVYYHQGIDKHWTNRLESDFWMPERAKLGRKAILNKEIYFSGVVADDNNIFAYQDIYDELRFKANRISGKIADSSNKSFYPYTQARHFTSTPKLTPKFVQADNIRKDYLVNSNEDAYSCQFKIGDRCVRELPYRARPAQII